MVKYAASIITVLGLALAGFIANKHQIEVKPAESRSWPMSETEKLAVGGFDANLQRVMGDLAALETASRAAAQIAQNALLLGRAEAVLEREAERHCGVAVVRSGMTWVERK